MNIVSLSTRLEHRLVLPVRAYWKTDRMHSHGGYMQLGRFKTTADARMWERRFLQIAYNLDLNKENSSVGWSLLGEAAIAAVGGELSRLQPLALERGQRHYVIESGEVASLTNWEFGPDIDTRAVDPLEAVREFGYYFRTMAIRGLNDLPD